MSIIHIPRKGECEILAFGTDCESKRIIVEKGEDVGYGMYEHLHQYHEILIGCSSTPCTHTANGRVYGTDTPFIVYRAPYLLHSTNTLTDDPYVRWQVAFSPGVLEEFGGICSLGRLAGRWDCLIPVTAERIAELEPFLLVLSQARDSHMPKGVWVGAMAVLLHKIQEMAADDVSDSVSHPPYLPELMRYIVEHIEEELNVDDLARQFYVSRAKLMRDFRTITQYTVYEYITAIRLTKAKIWLAEDIPIEIIAQRCGFSGESAFIGMFRRETGLTPGEFRKRDKEKIKKTAGNA